MLKPCAKTPLCDDQPSQQQQDTDQPGDHDHGGLAIDGDASITFGRSTDAAWSRPADGDRNSAEDRSLIANWPRRAVTASQEANLGARARRHSVPAVAIGGSTGRRLEIRSGT